MASFPEIPKELADYVKRLFAFGPSTGVALLLAGLVAWDPWIAGAGAFFLIAPLLRPLDRVLMGMSQSAAEKLELRLRTRKVRALQRVGADFERRVVQLFNRAGFVTTAPARPHLGDAGHDLVLTGDGHIVLAQIKRYTTRMPPPLGPHNTGINGFGGT